MTLTRLKDREAPGLGGPCTPRTTLACGVHIVFLKACFQHLLFAGISRDGVKAEPLGPEQCHIPAQT